MATIINSSDKYKETIFLLQYNIDFEKLKGGVFYFHESSPILPVPVSIDGSSYFVTLLPEMQVKIDNEFEKNLEKSIKDYKEKINPSVGAVIVDVESKNIPVIFDLTLNMEVGLYTKMLPMKIGRYIFGICEKEGNPDQPFVMNTQSNTKNISLVNAMNVVSNLLKGKDVTDFGAELLFLLSSKDATTDSWVKYSTYFSPTIDVENSVFIGQVKERLAPSFVNIINSINKTPLLTKFSVVPASTFVLRKPIGDSPVEIILDYRSEISYLMGSIENIFYYPGNETNTVIVILKKEIYTTEETSIKNYFLELDFVDDVVITKPD